MAAWKRSIWARVAAAAEMMVQRRLESFSGVKFLLLMSARSIDGTEWKTVHCSRLIRSKIVSVRMSLGRYNVASAQAPASSPATRPKMWNIGRMRQILSASVSRWFPALP